LQRAAAPVEEFWLWPENQAAWNLWLSVQTQWRTGMGGRESLDYPGVEVVMRHGVRPKDRRRRFAEIQLMERVALRTWAAKALRGR
jgi:hypothetical protein